MHRSDSIYDDSPAERYQFPSGYLSRAKTCVGDWVVYLEPSKVRETRGYFAIARVERIIHDPKAAGMYLALIEAGSYLEFVNSVPFNESAGPVERGLLNDQGKLSGRAQAAVRPIAPIDFDRILEQGMDDSEPVLPRVGTATLSGFEEDQTPFIFELERSRVLSLTSRPKRDRVFRRIVLRAYDERCAITGLKLINGGGRADLYLNSLPYEDGKEGAAYPAQKSVDDITNNTPALNPWRVKA